MTAMMSWNVRIIDYLTERGVNPYEKDKYGFSAVEKAKIKNFRTIQSMLGSYEQRYRIVKGKLKEPPIFTEKWRDIIKEKNLNLKDYEAIDLWREDSEHFG